MNTLWEEMCDLVTNTQYLLILVLTIILQWKGQCPYVIQFASARIWGMAC